MTMTTPQAILTILMVVLGTAITRFLPFLLFPAGRQIPRFIGYLGRTLPYAMIGFLIVYCLKAIDFTALRSVLPAALALAAICALHLWKRNSLLSIAAGTILYMLLVRLWH